MLEIGEGIAIPDEDLELSFARSGGSGGQNVNKVSSKAILRFRFSTNTSVPAEVKERFAARFATRLTKDGDVVLSCERHRDQPKNVEECRTKLKVMLLEVLHPPKKRRPTRRTKGSNERRLAEKKRKSDTKTRRRGSDE